MLGVAENCDFLLLPVTGETPRQCCREEAWARLLAPPPASSPALEVPRSGPSSGPGQLSVEVPPVCCC